MGALAKLGIVLVVVAAAWFFGGDILNFLGSAAHFVFFDFGWFWFLLALFLLFKQRGSKPIPARDSPQPALSDDLKFWGLVVVLGVLVLFFGHAAWNFLAPLVYELGEALRGLSPF